MVTMDDIIQDLIGLTQCESPSVLRPSPLLVMLAIALPHFLYAFIWFKPQAWKRMFPNNAVDAFATAGIAGKVVQFTAVLLWFASIRDNGICLDTSTIGLPQWLAFLVLVSYGQSLNAGIFQAIGHEGVYYGTKLGHRIPWVNGWPFDTVSHPQYVGSVLTIWGLTVLVWNQAQLLPVLATALFWTAVYCATAVQEQYL